MIIKMNHSKADPQTTLSYILRPRDRKAGKEVCVGFDTLHVDVDGIGDDPASGIAKQYRKAMREWGKGTDPNEVQTMNFIISPSPRDNVTPEKLLAFANEIAELPELDGFLMTAAVHENTDVMHMHVSFCAVNSVDGHHMNFKMFGPDKLKDLYALQDKMRDIGAKAPYYFSRGNTERSAKHLNAEDMRLGEKSDRMFLMRVIEQAEADPEVVNRRTFHEAVERYGAERGVKMPEWNRASHKEFSYTLDGWKHNTRGPTLGADYTKEHNEIAYYGRAYRYYVRDTHENDPRAMVVPPEVYIARLRADEDCDPTDPHGVDLIPVSTALRGLPSVQPEQTPERADTLYMQKTPSEARREPSEPSTAEHYEKPVEARREPSGPSTDDKPTLVNLAPSRYPDGEYETSVVKYLIMHKNIKTHDVTFASYSGVELADYTAETGDLTYRDGATPTPAERAMLTSFKSHMDDARAKDEAERKPTKSKYDDQPGK